MNEIGEVFTDVLCRKTSAINVIILRCNKDDPSILAAIQCSAGGRFINIGVHLEIDDL